MDERVRLDRRLFALLFLLLSISLLIACGGHSSSGNGNPLSTTYTVSASAGSTVSVEFGPNTSYGQSTSTQAAPAAGGSVNVIVAGMRPDTTYHMRARITQPSGATTLDSD